MGKKRTFQLVEILSADMQNLNACKMLRETSEKITYIAGCAGYDNVSYFNRIFKKYVGKTPSQYRAERSRE